MSPAYQVRELLPTDGAALLAFYQSLPAWIVHWFAPFGQDVTPEKLDAHLAEAAAGNAISFGLVDTAGGIAGHGFIYSTRVEEPVFGIGLREGIVGQGWGHRLMRTVLAAADQRDLRRVTLTVFKDNVRARRLYELLGFVIVGEHDCRTPGDSLKMARERGMPAPGPVAGDAAAPGFPATANC
jgi:RimJ/RimL family protein N-acetyltransferase